MKEILIFAGTTEGRELSECLAQAGAAHTLCVATEYGEVVLKGHPLVNVRRGRMAWEEMAELLKEGDFAAVVDATHPYARAATENIRRAAEAAGVSYLRLKRESPAAEAGGRITCFETAGDCARALEGTTGNILLTTGSKELACFCASGQVRERLYVRVLPGVESLRLCAEQGVRGKQILALQGPFTKEMNLAMLRQYRIRVLVTKISGREGGYEEKLEAAREADIPVFAIGGAGEEPGETFAAVCGKLEEILGRSLKRPCAFQILLAGAGMGSRDTMTEEVKEAVAEADLLLGAPRLLEGHCPRVEKKPYYRAEQILPYLKEKQTALYRQEAKVVILFSGDSGFYSGCAALYRALADQIGQGALQGEVRILPGVSSVSYLAACLGESYQDVPVYSLHGREWKNLIHRLKETEKAFLLLSGPEDLARLGEGLLQAGMTDCLVYAGYQLSYPGQQVRKLTPQDCLSAAEPGLYTCLVKNPAWQKRRLAHGRPDRDFVRDKTPMTKEEVREVAVCKLRLAEDAVVYDIGSGTGSVAVEIAGLPGRIQVYALERDKGAAALLGRNKEAFALDNLLIREGEAPESFAGLPAPTHAFLGGSGGRFFEICQALYEKNPRMRVVASAVTLETLSRLQELGNRYPMRDLELVQIQVSRANPLGGYHLFQAQNPVWLCSFTFEPPSAAGQEEV